MSVDRGRLRVALKEETMIHRQTHISPTKERDGQLTTVIFLLECLSAVRAEGKIRINSPSARRAGFFRNLLIKIHASAVLIDNSIAVFAGQKRGAPLDRKHGDKKQAHVMIYPLEINPKMPTGRARPGLPINSNCFGLNPANKEEHWS